MSLRGRLLLIILVLNLAVIGVVQVASLWVHKERSGAQRDLYHRVLENLLVGASRDRLEDVVAGPGHPAWLDTRWVRKLVRLESFRTVFRDVMVTTGGVGRRVDLNPMGASHRAPDFPLQEVRDGIQKSIEEGVTVPVGEGLCVPIEVGGRFASGAWYLPVEFDESLPFRYFAVPVLLSTLLIGVLAFFGIGRSVVRPLHKLGLATARVGAGESRVRVDHVPGARELNGLVDAFNAMAHKVAGHTEELQREVRRATDETARRERALVVSSRLAAMGTLAAGIAHEINNPIGGMLNATHRLLQRKDLDDRSRQYLELILDGLDRVSTTARRVLDFSPRQIEAAPFPLASALDSARALVEHRCERAMVELRVDFPGDLPDVFGDRHEIQQVLLNFLLNSLDALEGRDGPRWISFAAEQEDAVIRLVVEDNGPGVGEETLAQAMDPFFSNKENPAASGLGLFISYSIIKNHGGDMELSSPPGKGFRIELRLPANPSREGGVPHAGPVL